MCGKDCKHVSEPTGAGLDMEILCLAQNKRILIISTVSGCDYHAIAA